MKHLIDADKLKALLEAQIEAGLDRYGGNLKLLLESIDSLQQEQPKFSKSKFVFPNFLYARTVDNKTIDVSYAPQSLDAVEYIKNNTTEQSIVSLEKEIENEWRKCHPTDEGMGLESANIVKEQFDAIAHHFYELDKNTRKK